MSKETIRDLLDEEDLMLINIEDNNILGLPLQYSIDEVNEE